MPQTSHPKRARKNLRLQSVTSAILNLGVRQSDIARHSPRYNDCSLRSNSRDPRIPRSTVDGNSSSPDPINRASVVPCFRILWLLHHNPKVGPISPHRHRQTHIPKSWIPIRSGSKHRYIPISTHTK